MPQPPTRRDLGWRRANLLALLVLCLLAAAVLMLSLPGRMPVGQHLPIFPDRQAQASHRIDPNTADEAMLRMLPGIGPEMARKIVEYRQSCGATQPFTQPADLAHVPRIGPATIELIEPWLEFPGN